MMVGGGGDDWQLVVHDNLSTGSREEVNHGTFQNITTPPASESTYLRSASTCGGFVSGAPSRKAIISALSMTVVVIVCTVFATLYFSGRTGTNTELLRQVKAESLTDTRDVIVRDITDDEEDDSAGEGRMMSDQPQPPSPRRKSPRKKNNRNKSPVHVHGHRDLPVNASSEHPFSLLYHLKLVNGRDEAFTQYHKCVEVIETDRKQIMKGWKALVTVDFSRVGFNPPDNHTNVYIGYGQKKKAARERAAQQALLSLYPRQLSYSDTNELSEIEPFCEKEQVTTTTPKTTTAAQPPGQPSTAPKS